VPTLHLQYSPAFNAPKGLSHLEVPPNYYQPIVFTIFTFYSQPFSAGNYPEIRACAEESDQQSHRRFLWKMDLAFSGFHSKFDVERSMFDVHQALSGSRKSSVASRQS